jgi:hypothetical protein
VVCVGKYTRWWPRGSKPWTACDLLWSVERDESGAEKLGERHDLGRKPASDVLSNCEFIGVR